MSNAADEITLEQAIKDIVRFKQDRSIVLGFIPTHFIIVNNTGKDEARFRRIIDNGRNNR